MKAVKETSRAKTLQLLPQESKAHQIIIVQKCWEIPFFDKGSHQGLSEEELPGSHTTMGVIQH